MPPQGTATTVDKESGEIYVTNDVVITVLLMELLPVTSLMETVTSVLLEGGETSVRMYVLTIV